MVALVEEVAAGISELVESSGCRGSEVEVMLGEGGKERRREEERDGAGSGGVSYPGKDRKKNIIGAAVSPFTHRSGKGCAGNERAGCVVECCVRER